MNCKGHGMDLRMNGVTMMKTTLMAVLLAMAAGCNEGRDQIDQVQTNIVDKAIFEGDWFYQETLIKLTGDNALFTGEFVGDNLNYDFGTWQGEGIPGTYEATENRIRWIVDRDVLHAFRSSELVDGGNVNATDPDFLGEPIAAFKIIEHLDIRNDYNPVTGEKGNIRVENASDRRWFERSYMRVDWSTNLISRVINFDGFSDEPAGVLAEEGTVWPERWYPEFVTPADNLEAPYASEFASDEVYYMSFVTRRVRSPGYYCLFGYGPCSSLVYTVRSSFLKSSPDHQYAALQEPGIMYDRFGIIRLGQPTYTRGGGPDPEYGIAPDYGETDFVNYYAMRHNMWVRHFGDDGNPLPEAELWAPNNLRGIRYMMSDRYPTYLIRPGLQVFVEWNRPFAAMVRRHNGDETPEEGGPDYDCGIVGGDGTGVEYPGPPEGGSYPDTYEAFDGDKNLRMDGTECYVSVEVNPCDIDPAQECVELGDIRYHFFNLIPDPGPWFCGVSIPTADPRSGELLSANINTTAQCLDAASTNFLDYVHVLRDGTLDDAGIISGEDIREYMASNGRVRYPVALGPSGPLYNADRDNGNGAPSFGQNENPWFDAAALEALRGKMESLRALQGGAEGRAQIMSDARRALAGSGLERDMLEMMGPDAVDLARTVNPGADIPLDATMLDDTVAEQVSPFRGGGMITTLRNADPTFQAWPARPGRIYEPGIDRAFQDPNLEAVIATIPGSVNTDAKLAIWFKRRILLWVMLHELGHSLGMEHNFAGSIDRSNYLDDWYAIDAANPLPRSEDYGLDTAPDADDLRRYADDTREARDTRDAQGIAMSQYTSVMDYMFLAERMTPKLGKYDHAAVSWSYGNQVEIYQGDPRVGQDDYTIDPTSATRGWVNHYLGGETCIPARCLDDDEDPDNDEICTPGTRCPNGETCASACPYDGAARGANQAVRQRCMENPRYERQAVPCGEGDQDCLCSSYEDDIYEASQYGYDCNGDGRIRGTEVNWDCNEDDVTDYWPVDYMTCSNSRLSDISWCNTFDRGSSFREVVQNYQDNYNRYYVWRNFRRHEPMFSRWTGAYYVAGSMYDAVKIFQHLFYRYFYEEDFSARTGPLGFWDEFLSSVDTLNWMNSILAQPDVGSYDLDPETNLLQLVSHDPDGTGDYDLPLAPGKWIFSQNQGNEYGVFNTERSGILFEKTLALEALARRDWSLGYTYDERFYTNFYDFFSTTMEQVFGGAVRGDVSQTGALYDESDGSVIFPNVFHGLGDLTGRPEHCIDPATQNPDGLPAIADAEPLLIREIAAAWALSEFAVFYDTSFAQQMYIFVEGSGEGVTIPETNPRTGEPFVEGTDYVRYTSETRGKTYMSLAVEPPLRYPGCAPQSISFLMLSEGNADQARLQELRADLEADPDNADLAAAVERQRLEVANRDSFIELLIDMQRRFGISNYFQ